MWPYVAEFVSLANLKLFTCNLFFFLTEKYCCYLEVEEKVERGSNVGSVPDGGDFWMVMMDSDAESRLHAHCGALESLGRNPEKSLKLREDRTG